jgi:hypothetical protein
MGFFQGIKGKLLILKIFQKLIFFSRASIFVNESRIFMIVILSSVVLLAFLASIGLTLLILGCALAE